MLVEEKEFGVIDGQKVTLFTIKNRNGFQVSCMNYGCVITEILATDRRGQYENVVLGYDTLEEYGQNNKYLGAVVGRVAGRIKGGAFSLGKNFYQLLKNEKNNHLHGGSKGFSHVVWKAKVLEDKEGTTIEFTYLSRDGEEGYPGNLKMKVSYKIMNDQDKLSITYTGISDKDTLVNVTNHSYFNLSGDLKRDIVNHELIIDSSKYLELDKELLPTGKLIPVDNSTFDFRKGRVIANGLNSIHPQNALVGNGYDHPFILDKKESNQIVLTEEISSRKLVVETTEAAVILYTANTLGSGEIMRGEYLRNYLGVCLETQGPPDSVHHSHFQSSVLLAGETYQSTTVYSFGLI